MKKLIRILLWIAGIFVALLILAIVAVKIFLPVEKIKAMAVEEGSARLGREIVVEGLDLSIWGGLGVELQGVRIGNPEGFESGDLLTADKVDLKLQLLPLIFGDIRVNRLVIDRPDVRLLKTASGAVNYSFESADSTILPEEARQIPAEGQAAALVISFEELDIRDGSIWYRDDSTGMSLRLTGFDLASSLEYPRDGFYQSSGRLRADTVLISTAEPYPPVSIDLNYRTAFDLATGTLSIENINANVNDLRLKLVGQLSGLPDLKAASMNVSSDQIAIADLLSLLSPEQRAKLTDYSMSGSFSLDVDLTYPVASDRPEWVYTGTAALNDVRMSAASFPGELAFRRCLVDFQPDNLRLNIEDGSFDGRPLKGYLVVDNFTDPVLSGELAGGLDLALVEPFLPAGPGHEVSGRTEFDLKFSGPIKVVDSLVFSGELKVSGGKYRSALVPEPIENFDLDAYLDRRLVNLRRLDCRFPSGQLSLKGRLTDLVPYLLADSVAARSVSPTVEADIKGTVDLAMAKPYLPPRGNPQLSGELKLDVNVTGRLKSLESLRSRGQVTITGGSYADSLLPEPIERFDAELWLKPDTIDIRRLDAKFTSSDISMKGQLIRPFPYFLPVLELARDSLPQPLLLFELSSHRFDTDRLFPEAVPGAGAEATTLSVDSLSPVILPDIEGRGTVRADTVIYCKVELTEVTGKVRMLDRKIECYDASARVYTGSVSGKTTIDLSDFERPRYVGEFKAEQIESDDFVSRFSKFGGHLFGKADFAGSYNAQGWEPAEFFSSLTMDGDLNVRNGKLVTTGAVFSAFSELGSRLGKTVDKEQALKDLMSKVIVRDGRVFTDSLKSVMGGLGNLALIGSYGFDETLDYSGMLSLSEVSGGQLGAVGKLFGQKDTKQVNVPFKIGGTILSPRVEIDYEALGKQLGENLLNQAVDRLKKR